MTPEPGTHVRTLVDLVTDQGQIVPIDTPAEVIGAKGERLILSIEDPETGERMTAEAKPWEVLRRTSIEDAWARLDRADWMLWLAGAFGVDLPVEAVCTFAFGCADRAIHVHAVDALRAAGLAAEADRLSAVPAIVDESTAGAAAGAAGAARAEHLWQANRLRELIPTIGGPA